MALPTSPSYLVELMDPELGTFHSADVTRYLENAISTVHKHLADFSEPVDVQVTIDPHSRELAGVVFYSEEAQPISVIRPFYLDRESVECDHDEIRNAADAKLSQLEKNLNRIFTR